MKKSLCSLCTLLNRATKLCLTLFKRIFFSAFMLQQLLRHICHARSLHTVLQVKFNDEYHLLNCDAVYSDASSTTFVGASPSSGSKMFVYLKRR
jgi:hypothetical protein